MITKIYKTICVLICGMTFTACSDFLEEQVPQATLIQDEVKDSKYIDNVLVSAYAGLLSIEDMNSSFSLWNYDTRSDDAYVGGSNKSDGGEFHIMEMGVGITTKDWPYNDIWNRMYKYLSRISLSMDMLMDADQNAPEDSAAYGRDEVPACLRSLPAETSVQAYSFCQQAEYAGGRL